MPKMRVMSWVLFTLSLAFFFVQDFRWALKMPYLEWKNSAEAFQIPPDQLRALAERARQNRDAQSLAFVALQSTLEEDIALANQAVALDPSLTWIYYDLAYKRRFSDQPWKSPAFAPTLKDWTLKLEAFDPQNAAPHLLRAEVVRDAAQGFQDAYGPKKRLGGATPPAPTPVK